MIGRLVFIFDTYVSNLLFKLFLAKFLSINFLNINIMFELGVLEIGIVNIAIILTVITNSIFMYYTLKIYTLNYFLLLIFCSLGALITNISILVLLSNQKHSINPQLSECVAWILYTQSYLFFLTSYYKDLLKSWQTRICHTINFVNFIAQIIFTVFYSFDLGFADSSISLIVETTENISATSTVLSETILTICIFYIMFKLRKTTSESEIKLMLVKVIMTMILMWSLDIIVIYLEYSGGMAVYAYFTKPTVICFKFYCELLILGNCKKYLFMISGIDSW
jgi:hypothetical protein